MKGSATGGDAVYATVARWLRAWDAWHEEIEEMRDLGGQMLVVSKQRGRAKGSGIEVESDYAVLYDVLGDKITRMAIYAKPEQALETAGLSE